MGQHGATPSPKGTAAPSPLPPPSRAPQAARALLAPGDPRARLVVRPQHELHVLRRDPRERREAQLEGGLARGARVEGDVEKGSGGAPGALVHRLGCGEGADGFKAVGTTVD